jgi:hypothetical protein
MRPKFLKPNLGTFNHGDLIDLAGEVNSAYGVLYPNLNPEKLGILQDVKSKIEYMVNTQQISDHMIQEAISEFNKAFSGNKEYVDDLPVPEKAHGFINVGAELADQNPIKTNTINF